MNACKLCRIHRVCFFGLVICDLLFWYILLWITLFQDPSVLLLKLFYSFQRFNPTELKPTIAMLIGIMFFASGSLFYTRDEANKNQNGNVIINTVGVVASALKYKLKNWKTAHGKSHWLDYDDSSSYSPQLIADVKVLCKVLYVFLPFPAYYALYDQQGSR